MANQATVIDIDTKFLDNIKKSEQALINAANAADRMTQMFVKATQGSGNMAAMFQSIQAGLDKVGAKADFSSGFLKANTALRGTVDMVNTLAHNINDAKSRYSDMLSTMANKSNRMVGGTFGIQMIKPADLNNISILKDKIADIDEFLNRKRSSQLTTDTILRLTEFKEFYKQHVKELGKTDEQRFNEELNRIKAEFNEKIKTIREYEKVRASMAKSSRAANIEQFISDPQKAIQFADKARTGSRLNVAKNILTQARNKTTDQKEIAKINEALQLVEDKLNKINGKELKLRVKENLQIVKTSDDVTKLQRAVEALNRDKLSFNVDTTAGKKKVDEINAAIDQARNKISELSSVPVRTEIGSYMEQKAGYKQAKRDVAKASDWSTAEGELNGRAEISQRLINLQDQINTSTKKGYDLYVKTGEQLRQNEALMTQAALKTKDAKVSLDPKGGALNIGNVESLVKMTNDAKTLRNAFEAIRRAKRDINPNTEEGRAQLNRLNEALATTERKIKDCTNSQSKFVERFNAMKGSGAGFSNMFSRIFATTAIMGFTNKVVSLHGEFEKLRKSLAVLVQGSEKANLIWGKITRLAVQSPFTVSDLATATRQMAAYQIEQDKIYEKTKMLADVSAGLGVEMSRLILAYGQVKAANFLRGTELRQFSEAGIDMLGQLATYFTQLEGRLVTAADVMKRISKRQVMFEDVDEVLQRVTSRGGAFYKMQEEMATTVAGRISNLKDEFMLSMDNIGKSHNETILKVIRMMKWLAQNLDVVVEKLGFLLQVWLAWKGTVIVNTLLTKGYAVAMSLVTLATHKATVEMGKLTAATHAFNAASKGNALLAIVSVAASVIGAFVAIPKAIDSATDSIEESELNEKMDHMADLAKEVASAYAAEQTEIEELSNKILNLTKNINSLNSADEDNVETSDHVAIMMRERSILLSSLAGKTSEYAAELSAVLHDEEAMGRIIERNNEKLAARTVVGHEISGINLGDAIAGLEDAYAARALPGAYSGGNEWDPNKVREAFDPNELIPEEIFEKEDEFLDRLNAFISKSDEFQRGVNGLIDYTINSGINEKKLKALGKDLKDLTDDYSDVAKYLDPNGEIESLISYIGKYDTGSSNDTSIFNQIVTDIHQAKEAVNLNSAANDKLTAKARGYLTSMMQTKANENVIKLVEILKNAVEDGMDTSGLSSEYGAIREETQRNIQSFLDSIFTQYEISDDAKVMLQQLLGEVLGFTWKDFETPLESWHENFNKYTDEIRASLADMNVEIPFSIREILSGDLTREDAKKAIEEELKAVNEVIRVYEDNINSGVSRLATDLEVENMRYQAAVKEFVRLGGTPEDAANYFGEHRDAIIGWAPSIGDIQYIGGSYTTAQYNEAKAQQHALEESLKFHGPDKDKDKNKKVASEAIKAINDVHKAFKELQKDFDDETSKVGAWEKYGKALEEALKPFGMSVDKFKSMFDLTTEDGMIEAFEWLKKQKGVAEELYEIEKAIGDITWEVRIEDQNEAAERLNREIENLFSGYELSVELEELHIPKDMAKKFFDIDVTSINELRKELFSRKGEFVGTDQEKEYQKFLDKLDEMETKSQQTRLKKYLDFSRDTIGERGKILFEGFNQLEDISKAFELTDTLALNENLISEKQFKAMREAGLTFSELMSKGDEALMSDAWGFTEEDIARIREYAELLEEQQKLAENASVKKTNEELAKFDWEQFTGSEAYQELYNDMSNASASALTVLINKLEDHREQWSKLPIDQVEKYVDLLNEAKDALDATKYPSEQIDAAKEEMAATKYSNVGEASSAMINAQLELEYLDKVESQWKVISKLKEEGRTNEDIALELGISKSAVEAKTKDELKSQRDTQNKIISDSKKYLDAVRKIQDAYEKQRELLNKIKGAVDKIWEGWADINSIFEDDTISAALQNLVKNVSDGVFGMMDMVIAAKQSIEAFKAAEEGAKSLGFAIDAASGILGIIVMGVKIIASILKFAFEQHDKMLQKQIDAQLEKVEILKDRYEELEKQIEKAYTAVDFGRLTREANKNLEAQIEATEKMIALEEDKKKPDDSAIDGWKDEIKDMQNTIEESFEEAFSTLSDGILDDVIGTTRSFVDAWHDAYEETGDGMIGLEETFTDMLRNMLRQQASMQLISPFIKKYKEWLKDYINPEGGDDMLTTDEAKMWAEKVRDTFPEVNELLENFFEGTQGLLETGGELSDLEKGIQGMTEDQAEVLAAYWNSCRFMISNIDVTLTRLADHVMTANDGGTSVIDELKNQTTILRDIRDYLSSVIGVGGNSYHSGSYIKVSM